MYGMTAHRIDYAMIMVGCNMGVNRSETTGSFAKSITYEHMNILNQLQIPFFIVMSKRDLCVRESVNCECSEVRCQCRIELESNPEYKRTKRDITAMLREMQYKSDFVETVSRDADVAYRTERLIATFVGAGRVPVIVTSNKSGFNINLLTSLLAALPSRKHPIYDAPALVSSATVFIESRYWKRGIGLIISGTLRGAPISIGDSLLLGPFLSSTRNGSWYRIRIKQMHNNTREDIRTLSHGQTGCIAFACRELSGKEDKRHLRNGIVAVSSVEDAHATWNFTAKITVLNHSTTITNNYQTMIHCLNVKQQASISLPPEDSILRSGSSITVGFRFMHRPEHIEIGSRFIFREGRTRGVGEVTALVAPQLEDAVGSVATGSGVVSSATTSSATSSEELLAMGEMRE
jgi:elongation factor 1-alpha